MQKHLKPFLWKKNITSRGAFLGAIPVVCYLPYQIWYECRKESIIYTASQIRSPADRQTLSQEHMNLTLNITSCKFTLQEKIKILGSCTFEDQKLNLLTSCGLSNPAVKRQVCRKHLLQKVVLVFCPFFPPFYLYIFLKCLNPSLMAQVQQGCQRPENQISLSCLLVNHPARVSTRKAQARVGVWQNTNK